MIEFLRVLIIFGVPLTAIGLILWGITYMIENNFNPIFIIVSVVLFICAIMATIGTIAEDW